MKIISHRTETIHFSRIIQGDESEELCILPVTVTSVVTSGFQNEGYASSEYKDELPSKDVVCVNGRYFIVGKTTCGKKEWLSVTLPPGLDPRPAPREWIISNHPFQQIPIVWDGPLIQNDKAFHRVFIRVREIIDPKS